MLATMASASNITAKDKEFILNSPDGHLKVTVYESSQSGNKAWKIERDGICVLQPSDIQLTTEKGIAPKKTRSVSHTSIDRTIEGINYKRATVHEQCNEMTLRCAGEFDLVVRAYNDGCAYRLVSTQNKSLRVIKESPTFAFGGDYSMFVPYVNDNRGGERYCYSFESYYDEQTYTEVYPDSLAITPLAVSLPEGLKAVVMETAVENYPGMFLYKPKENGQHTWNGNLECQQDYHPLLCGEFAPLPTQTVIGGFDRLNLVPVERANYIAEIQPRQALPWRIVLVTTDDTQLLSTDIPYCLAPQCRLDDISWIKPGKVAWDWWNNWNISGVDFRAGINTMTYKHYIDFASRNGLEYVIVDEGWSSQEDLMEYANDELSIPELVAYGKERNVSIILWSSWRNLIKDMERNMAHYAAAGVKGFKVDFFDRDDQEVLHSSYEIAACAAKYHLLVDYHGLKPSGVQRAYPNVVNFEGVKGLENCKWEPRVGNGPLHDMPRYDVSIPYLRMLPGPLDYTPGAMLNATRDHFFGNNDHPMSQGTRVHQMAMYTLYEAPLQMLADSPTHYEQNQECTDFIAQVPTTWDETVPLCGEMGEYVAIARRKGDRWFVAAMNNWTPRTLTIALDKFLSQPMSMDCFADGINADREATDYKHTTRRINPAETLTIELKPAGGWTAIFSL